jgi:hypothetical protein
MRDRLGASRREVVKDHDRIAARQQGVGEMRSDESSTPGDEDAS